LSRIYICAVCDAPFRSIIYRNAHFFLQHPSRVPRVTYASAPPNLSQLGNHTRICPRCHQPGCGIYPKTIKGHVYRYFAHKHKGKLTWHYVGKP